jgi:hypothetical protein
MVMRLFIFLSFVWTVQSCSTTTGDEHRDAGQDSVTVVASGSPVDSAETEVDTVAFQRPIPDDYVVYDIVGDSGVVIFTDKCVVFSNHSVEELAEIETKMTADDYMDFYDDMAYYGNEASLFLYERTKIERVDDKKYIRFVFSNGNEITIDRHKSTETIFFFNPEKGIRQCDTRGFIKEKYVGY